MRKNVTLLFICLLLSMSSCKKNTFQNTSVNLSTNAIKVPVGFTWENSRNLNITVNVADTRFQNMVHVISIYDALPALGGKLLAKGSATTGIAFKNKLYLSNQISQVYIVKTAPDNSTSIQKIQVGVLDIVLSIAE